MEDEKNQGIGGVVSPVGVGTMKIFNKKLFIILGVAILIILVAGGYFILKLTSSEEAPANSFIIPSSSGDNDSSVQSPGGSSRGLPGRGTNNDSSDLNEDTEEEIPDTTIPVTPPASLSDLLNGVGDSGGSSENETISATSGRVVSIPDNGFSASDGTKVLIRSLACGASLIDLSVETISGSPTQILFFAGDGTNLKDFTRTKSSTPIESFSLDVSTIPLNLPNTIIELGISDSSGNYTTLDVWDCQL